LRVGIGAIVGVTGGPATYARELVRALVMLGGDDRYVVFTDVPEAFASLDVERVAVPLRFAWQQVTWDHVRLPALLRRTRVDLYHGTKNILPWRCPVPAVVTVHDLAVYAMPETFAWPQRLHFRSCVPPSVRRAVRVIVDSSHARNDVVARLGVDPAQIAVVPLGVGAEHWQEPGAEALCALRRRYGLGERVVACAGTIQPRKRVEHAIEAFVRSGAVRRGWQLAIAGRLRPGYRPPWLRALPVGVHWLGALSAPELRALYSLAAIAVHASEYEGFGLVLLEAMAAGCAVVAVRATSIPEVVSDAGLLVERSDPALLATALAELLADETKRRTLGQRARARARGFTWEATARRTHAVYAEVARR